MSNVVGLRGETILPPGEPNPAVVEMVERLLEMARSGEITALAAVMIHCDESTSVQRRGGHNFRMVGGVTKMLHDMCSEME